MTQGYLTPGAALNNDESVEQTRATLICKELLGAVATLPIAIQILRKSRMRRRVRTDLCGGRSVNERPYRDSCAGPEVLLWEVWNIFPYPVSKRQLRCP